MTLNELIWFTIIAIKFRVMWEGLMGLLLADGCKIG